MHRSTNDIIFMGYVAADTKANYVNGRITVTVIVLLRGNIRNTVLDVISKALANVGYWLCSVQLKIYETWRYIL